jgi:hypothetical protein
MAWMGGVDTTPSTPANMAWMGGVDITPSITTDKISFLTVSSERITGFAAIPARNRNQVSPKNAKVAQISKSARGFRQLWRG